MMENVMFACMYVLRPYLFVNLLFGFSLPTTLSITRGHNCKVFKPQGTSRVRSTFSLYVQTANSLSYCTHTAGPLCCMIIN